MELNYIASFSPYLKLVASVKIVSDNLSVDDYMNNAIRESGILASDEAWAKVRQTVETILSRNQLRNAELSILVTELGIVMLERLEQP